MKKKRVYRDIECDSDEEVYFLMWCFELQERGYIDKVERAPTFKLTDGWINEYEEQLKTKTKIKHQTILQPSEYTPDFLLTFSEDKYKKLVWLKSTLRIEDKMDKLFIGTNDARIFLTSGYDNGNSGFPYTQALIEVKPRFDANSMTRLFKNNQKFLYDKYGIFVNLVKIPDIFITTFTPKEYTKTSGGKDKKINYKITYIENFLEQWDT